MQARIPYKAAIVISAALAMVVSGAPHPQVVGARSSTRAQEPASQPATEAAPGGEQGSAPAVAPVAAPAPPSEASLAKAKEVLAEITQAVGSAQVADLRSFAFEADTRRVFGDREMSSSFTMRFLFPDKFQRVEEMERPDGMPGGTVTMTVDGQESWMAREGGQGGGGFFRGPGARGRAGHGGPDGPHMGEGRRGGRANAMHGEFYRALVGMLPSAAPRSGLTFAHVGEAQAANGQTADVLDVTADGFSARVFVDRQTHLPLMMTYQAPSRGGIRVRRPPQQPESEEAQRRAREEIRREMEAQGPPPLVETKLFFTAYASEDGLQVPHKITRQVDDEVQEEWTITKVEVNPNLEPEQFKDKRKTEASRPDL